MTPLSSIGLGRRFRFGGRDYHVGQTYRFEDLPQPTQEDVEIQFEGRHYTVEDCTYRLVIIPYADLLANLDEECGPNLTDILDDPDVKRLARSIKRDGLHYPPVGEEGNHRRLAAVRLGMDIPEFIIECEES